MESNHGPFGFKNPPGDAQGLLRDCRTPHDGLATIHQALRRASQHDVAGATPASTPVHQQIHHINQVAEQVRQAPALDAGTLTAAKQNGFSDGADRRAARQHRDRHPRDPWARVPVYHAVDTCAAEFAARTPYLYSTYDDETEVPPGSTPKVIILGSGPNRIGQGIEFDYACVHASFALPTRATRTDATVPGDRLHRL